MSLFPIVELSSKPTVLITLDVETLRDLLEEAAKRGAQEFSEELSRQAEKGISSNLMKEVLIP